MNISEEFLEEFQNETDRGTILMGAVLLDEALRYILENYLLNNGKLKSSENIFDGMECLSNFSSKIKIGYFLGLISKAEKEECEQIRKIRNEVAHNLFMTFEHEKIQNLCKKLQVNLPHEIQSQRFLFISSVLFLKSCFIRRLEYVKERKVTECNAKYILDTKNK